MAAQFLDALSAGDLGVFVNGQDFVAVQSMRERFGQEIAYRNAFGSDHPIIRTIRAADENSLSFSFLLLKSGVLRGLNSYAVLMTMRDFEVQTKKGPVLETYTACNWSSVDIDTGMDQVMVNVDVSVPGFVNSA